MTAKKLTIGTAYDLDSLTLAGWTGPHDGLCCWDYFDASDCYLGPDADGIEPLFDVAE
jgi:hypothetical protein